VFRWLTLWITATAVITTCVLTFDHPMALLIRERGEANRLAWFLVLVPEAVAAVAIGAVVPLGIYRAMTGQLSGPWRTALFLGVGVCVALALKTEAKLLFGRVAPQVWFWHQSAPLRNFHLMHPGSFPSGHMAVMGMLAPFIQALAPKLQLPWLTISAAVGIALMLMGAHFFSDLLAGGLLGTTVGAACCSIAQAARNR
jgi:membrane-associated phospholipid phosphatase